MPELTRDRFLTVFATPTESGSKYVSVLIVVNSHHHRHRVSVAPGQATKLVLHILLMALHAFGFEIADISELAGALTLGLPK